MKKSVVVRGSLSYERHPQNFINEIVESIREWFPDELIISTWEGQEKYLDNNLPIDKIVLTKDPGPGPVQQWKRQAISYQQGIEASSGDLIMVTRSDIVHKKDLFQYLNLYPNYTDDLKVFSKKLIVANMMTIRPDSDEYPNCFRVSDWVQVGNREDIFIWSNILQSILELDETKLTSMNCTETLWFLSVLKNKFGDLIDIYDSSNINYLAWEAIVNNFIVLDTRTTMESWNRNWDFQPEYCPCYLNEEIYKKLYEVIS
jgi:hypothetical protein